MNSIQEFVDALNAKFNTDDRITSSVYDVEPGRKFTRVTVATCGQKSVYCFVQNDTLDVFKADGYKKPAKGIRANLKTLDMGRVDKYTSWLYRR